MFKPLLAATYEAGWALRFPVLGSPKLDGIRALNMGGKLYSRTLKEIRNGFIQQTVGATAYAGYDGELIVGSCTGELVYNRTNSGVMSGGGEPDFHYFVFDRWDMAGRPYLERLAALTPIHPRITVLPQVELKDQADMNAYEIMMLDEGYEGIMVRSMDGVYKMGRSTANEGILFKVKRFEDFEARVVGYEEMQSNTNSPILDHLGRSVRSKHQAGMVPGGMIGALLCVKEDSLGNPISPPFRVAPGTMTHDQRLKFFQEPSLLLKHMVKVKSFAYGVVDQPRFARYHGHRDPIDS